jgi:hypothetical protein
MEVSLDGKGVIACTITIPKCCVGKVAFERELMVSEKKWSKVDKGINKDGNSFD